jgi:hypothetical protein
MGMAEVQAALAAHAPISGPDYVPWWAKGEYARVHRHEYVTQSGVSVVAGEVAGKAKVVKEKIERVVKPEIDIPDLSLPELCDKYDLPHDLYQSAPNGGVATMRVRNAIRKLLAAGPI